jgi:hypothetical protein
VFDSFSQFRFQDKRIRPQARLAPARRPV